MFNTLGDILNLDVQTGPGSDKVWNLDPIIFWKPDPTKTPGSGNYGTRQIKEQSLKKIFLPNVNYSNLNYFRHDKQA